jgi:uncharacterized protein
MTMEYRSTGLGAASVTGDSVSGLVTPFNTWATIGDLKRGGFSERIAPGTFARTLRDNDVVLLFNHDASKPLARVSAGNLNLFESQEGLRASATPVDTSYGRDLLALTRSGVVRGMSFGFSVKRDSWADEAGNPSDSMRGTHRTIHEVELHEVSAVTFPAYTESSFAA